MLVVMRMFLEPIRDGLMRTLETTGVVGVAVEARGTSFYRHSVLWWLASQPVVFHFKVLNKEVQLMSAETMKWVTADMVFSRLKIVIQNEESLCDNTIYVLVLVVAAWEGGGICTVNLWAVRDTGVPTLEVTDCTDEVPVRKHKRPFVEFYFYTIRV